MAFNWNAEKINVLLNKVNNTKIVKSVFTIGFDDGNVSKQFLDRYNIEEFITFDQQSSAERKFDKIKKNYNSNMRFVSGDPKNTVKEEVDKFLDFIDIIYINGLYSVYNNILDPLYKLRKGGFIWVDDYYVEIYSGGTYQDFNFNCDCEIGTQEHIDFLENLQKYEPIYSSTAYAVDYIFSNDDRYTIDKYNGYAIITKN